MKRILLSLSIGFLSISSGYSQEGAARPAALGQPRASLGLPRSASEAGPNLIPTQHVEAAFPGLLAPVVRTQQTAPPPALDLDDPPKEMPKKAAIGEEKKTDPKIETIGPPIVPTPKASGPMLPAPTTSIVCADEPLFGIPVDAPPFINRERFQVSGEYLMWWSTSFHTPALVSTGPTASDGILGQAGASVLYGNQNVGSNMRSGYRLSSIFWCGERWGIDGRFFFLGKEGGSTSFSSDTNGVLARPFTDTNPSRSFSEIVASPGALTGGIIVSNSSYLWGGELNGRRKLYEGCCFNLDALIGYRFVNLTEELTINERSVRVNPTSVSPFVDANGTVHGAAAFDNFRTSNRFNGGQIGLAGQFTHGRWVFDVRSTVAFGVTQASVDIDGGQTVYYTNGNSATTRGGLLALNSNIGHHTSQHFAVIPEATFNIGYNITSRCRIFVGYNAMYWSHVLRPGDQISTTLDSSRIPNFGNTSANRSVANPSWSAQYRSYFAQGINFGLSYQW